MVEIKLEKKKKKRKKMSEDIKTLTEIIHKLKRRIYCAPKL